MSQKEGDKTFAKGRHIINNFIKLMINSGHAYQYVKSVILQALTKYTYVVYRSQLDVEHKLYSPIHRARDYQVGERRLTKYTDQALWYSEKIHLDKHKNTWKRWIVRKDSHWNNCRKGSNSNKHSGARDIRTTTAMFVPCTPGGQLLKQLQCVEYQLSPDFG